MSEIINPIMNKIGYPASENFENNINGILPPELFIHCIFKYLDLQGLHCALLTCKQWKTKVLIYLETKGTYLIFKHNLDKMSHF